MHSHGVTFDLVIVTISFKTLSGLFLGFGKVRRLTCSGDVG